MNFFTHKEIDDAIQLVNSDRFHEALAIIDRHIKDIEAIEQESNNELHQLIKNSAQLMNSLRSTENGLRSSWPSFEPMSITTNRIIVPYKRILNATLRIHHDYDALNRKSK